MNTKFESLYNVPGAVYNLYICTVCIQVTTVKLILIVH